MLPCTALGAPLHGHLVPQAVRQILRIQHVEEPSGTVGASSLPLTPAVPVIALICVWFILRSYPRLPKPEQLQGSQDRALIRGSVAGNLPCVQAVWPPGGEAEALETDSAAADPLSAGVGAHGAWRAGRGQGGDPGAVTDLLQGLSCQRARGWGGGEGVAGRAGGLGPESDLQKAVLGAHWEHTEYQELAWHKTNV